MWFDLVLDVLAATILIPIIIGAVVTYGKHRERIAPQRRAQWRHVRASAERCADRVGKRSRPLRWKARDCYKSTGNSSDPENGHNFMAVCVCGGCFQRGCFLKLAAYAIRGINPEQRD